jgi:sugar-phosphatase
MVRAVIFDMDGLLIDTEPYWQATEREVFGALGIKITPDMQVATFGLRSDEQIRYWYDFNSWKDIDFKAVENRYNDLMLSYFREKAELMEGAIHALEFFSKKGLPMALASSSNMDLINVFLDRFGLHRYFGVVYSAEFEEFGKPHPAVYLETARRLNTETVNCLALEDSFHGLIAAKAARMKTIAVPAEMDDRYLASDVVLSSLNELNESIFQGLSK